jgi:hypothetical protein
MYIHSQYIYGEMYPPHLALAAKHQLLLFGVIDALHRIVDVPAGRSVQSGRDESQ